jgi:hypothetical protein
MLEWILHIQDVKMTTLNWYMLGTVEIICGDGFEHSGSVIMNIFCPVE